MSEPRSVDDQEQLSGWAVGGITFAACILTKESIADQRLVIVTENGIGIRIKVGEVRVTSSRSAQGVKLIELNETDRVKTVECIDVSKKDGEVVD